MKKHTYQEVKSSRSILGFNEAVQVQFKHWCWLLLCRLFLHLYFEGRSATTLGAADRPAQNALHLSLQSRVGNIQMFTV